MNRKIRHQLAARKRRIAKRLDRTKFPAECPVISATNIHYELAERTQAISAGGIGVIQRLVKWLGLDAAINREVSLLKLYMPYAESDHVLNIAYNLLAGGTCLEHLELRRNDENYLNALGAQRIPDPTTAGDFCRRFNRDSIHRLMDVFNAARQKVWRQQPDAFFDEAVIDADGTMVETTGDVPTKEQAVATRTDYVYDRLGRLTEVNAVKQGGADGDGVTEYRYDALGNLDQVETPNGVIADYDYDALNRLTFLRHFKDDPSDGDDNEFTESVDPQLATYDYTVRADGKRTGVVEKLYYTDGFTVDQTSTFSWDYDLLGRLTSEQYDSNTLENYTTTYGFDLASNRLKKETDILSDGSTDETISYAYDKNDRLLSEEVRDGSSTLIRTVDYEYGPNATSTYGGAWTQLTKKTEVDVAGGGTTKVTDSSYNPQGRLSTVEIDDTNDGMPDSTINYEYNDNGIRFAQTVNGEKTLYLIDENNHTGYAQILEEGVDSIVDGRLDAGEVEKTYLLGHDVLSQYDSNGLLYLLTDGHGSTRGLVDATGQPLSDQIYAYDAYGNRLDSTGSNTLTTILYSGEVMDALTGLQYLRARYYNPATGTFNRLDPFAGNLNDPQSLHKYLYAHGDPVSGVDPTGQYNLQVVLTRIAVGSMLTTLLTAPIITGFAVSNSIGLPDAIVISVSGGVAGFAFGGALTGHLVIPFNPLGIYLIPEFEFGTVPLSHFKKERGLAGLASFGAAWNLKSIGDLTGVGFTATYPITARRYLDLLLGPFTKGQSVTQSVMNFANVFRNIQGPHIKNPRTRLVIQATQSLSGTAVFQVGQSFKSFGFASTIGYGIKAYSAADIGGWIGNLMRRARQIFSGITPESGPSEYVARINQIYQEFGSS